jgi:hypothetical protein
VLEFSHKLKWFATFCILAAVAFRSNGTDYYVFDMWFGFVGSVAWTVVAAIWKDRALFLLNIVMSLMLGVGLLDCCLL